MRTIRWSRDAQDDYAEILDFAADQDPSYAAHLESRISAAARLLAERPIGRSSPIAGLSQKLVLKTPFLIAYRASDTELTIMRLIHQRQDWRPGEWPKD